MKVFLHDQIFEDLIGCKRKLLKKLFFFIVLLCGMVIVNQADAQFSGEYALINWVETLTNSNGSLDLSGLPDSVSVTASNNLSKAPGKADYTRAICTGGIISFDWSYLSANTGSLHDPFGILLNGLYYQLTIDSAVGGLSQSGQVSVPVSPGDVFGFSARTMDNEGGAATTTITNFSAPVDTVLPTVSCTKNFTVSLDQNGNAIVPVSQVDNNSFDNCCIDTMFVSPNTFACDEVGIFQSVTLTVIDCNGNQNSCITNANVQDNIDPEILCQDITIYLDALGAASITAADIDNGSNDACGIDTLFLDMYDFDCSHVGANTVTLTGFDINGNDASCTASVIVIDTVSPMALCQNLTIYLDANGDASITPAQVDNGSNDACGILSLTLNEEDFDCEELGQNTVTLTVVDSNFNSSTCDATITVLDTTSPMAMCQDLTIYLDASGSASITAADVNNNSTDNCHIDSLGIDKDHFSCADVGANIITLTVIDQSGNSDQCHATVTALDTVSPHALCKNETIYLDNSGMASIMPSDIDNGSSDACGILSLSLDKTSFNCGDVSLSPVTVTLTVTDNNANTSTCTALVTVLDTVSPNALCQDLTIYLDGQGIASITPGQVDNGSNDACGVLSLALDSTHFDCAEVGANTVTLTVTDNNQNSATCMATITVADTISPTAICANLTIQLDSTGNASITTGQINNGSNDECGLDTVYLDRYAFTCADVGANTVTLTAVDNNGNSATCTATVTVQDNVNPNAICQNISIQLDASGNASITAGDIDNGSNDACGIDNLSLDKTTFTCAEVGANTVTLTVTDVNGNMETCTATVTVNDTVSPNAICKDLTIQLDAQGSATLAADDIDNGSNDACGIASTSIDKMLFSCAEVGANTVTLTVVDSNGNSSTCTSTVTVSDTVKPIAICKSHDLYLDANGLGSIVATDVDNGSNDACGIASLSVLPNSFDCSNVGANTVTLTVVDSNSNMSTCTATVNVYDTVPPVALCMDYSHKLDVNGQLTITTADIDSGSYDACGIQSLSLNKTVFSCQDKGDNTVVLTVTDNNGNVSTCSANVQIIDDNEPIAICVNSFTVALNNKGKVIIPASFVDFGSFDNCYIDSIDLTPNMFTCADLGTNTVTLTVWDQNGNNSFCTTTITVQDNLAPAMECKDDSVYLDVLGAGSISVADIDNGSFDICGIETIGLSKTNFLCEDVGIQTVTLTASDSSGNTASCTANVYVFDTVKPAAICQDIDLYLDNAGMASIGTGDIDNGSNDACGILSLELDSTNFDCSEVGANTVTLTVTDNNSNVSTCTATVTVFDTIPPVALCQDLTIYLDSAGNASIMASQIDNGSNDACGIDTISLDQYAFDCSQVGTNTVTLTVTDNNGNSSTCTGIVTVIDNIQPYAICQDLTLYLDAAGSASITAADVDNGSNDACGINTLMIDKSSFDCSHVGANTITLTVIDNNNNTSTCTSTATVLDTVKPIAICQDITIYLDMLGSASITEADINNGSNDACGIFSLSLTPTQFDCANVGANAVTLTVTDSNSNVSTCAATVTVLDTVPPVALCKDLTLQLDSNGMASITTADIDNGSNDACGIAGLALDKTSFTCADVGANTVTLTVTDNNANMSMCTATVTVEDNVDPKAICQDLTLYLDALGAASITAMDIDNGSSDACGIDTLYLDKYDFSCAEVGANSVSLTVKDVNGNMASCSATVTVLDTVKPEALCKDATIYLDNQGAASIVIADIDNGSNDACGIASLALDQYNFDCSHVGPNTVILTVIDSNANQSTCSATVTVIDTVPPVAICKDISLYLDANGMASIVPADVDNGSNDACGIASLAIDSSDFDCSEVGFNTVILTVTDNNSNVSTCAALVEVFDTVPPTAICMDDTVYLDKFGAAGNTTADIDGGSFDACGIASLSLDQSTFDCDDIPGVTVTLTVTDVNGNASTCTSLVTVLDEVAPTPICTYGISLTLNATGNVYLPAFVLDNGSFDNCGVIDSLIISQSHFTCADVGDNIVTLTAIDQYGNSAFCTTIIKIQDNVFPTALCADSTVQLDVNGQITINSGTIDNESFDNCGIDTMIVDPADLGCADVGQNTITLYVTDFGGNTSTCTAIVTVEDNIAPEALCQDITLALDATGNATITPADIDSGSSDACGIALYELDKTAFDCSEVGPNTVILTLTDSNSNVSSCSATVTVIDTVAPNALCQDLTLYLDDQGAGSIAAADVDNGSDDNCDIDSLYLDAYNFSCTEVGANSVTLTALDVNGNTSTCGAIITVVDSVSPQALCQNVTISLDSAGNASITESDIDNGSNDACGIATIALDIYSFTCANTGSNTVTLTVTDNNANISTCDAIVTVEDNIDPVALCKDISIQLDVTGMAVITPGDIDNGSSDICGLASLSIDKDTFTCANVGNNIVTLTVFDNNGNGSTCQSNVAVSDDIKPTMDCQDITVQLDGSGIASIVAADVAGNTADACGLASLTLSKKGFSCLNIGQNTVTLTATDVNGNVDSCTAIVTIEDTIAPFANCRDITVALDASGNVTISTIDIESFSFEACGIDSMILDNNAFNCSNVGPNTVILTIFDPSGNSDTCSSTVTVLDITAPVVTCNDIDVYLDDNGMASIAAADLEDASNDVCGVDTLYLDKYDFSCADLGANTVTLFATDVNGNTGNCQSTVTVIDTIAPEAMCQNATVYLDGNGEFIINAGSLNNGSTDACGVASVTFTDVPTMLLTCADVGLNTLIVTVKDSSGNAATCLADVTVIDTVKPIALCQDIAVNLNNDGIAAFTAAQIDNGSNDACGIASLSIDIDSLDCDDIGPNTVVLTATDVNGNSSTCTATVTVSDMLNPVAICNQGLSVGLDSVGSVVVPPNAISNKSSDNCGISSISISPNTFTCAELGLNNVTLTVIDNSGNSSFCTTTITVQDPFSSCAATQCDSIENHYEASITYDGVRLEWIPTIAAVQYEVRGRLFGTQNFISLTVPGNQNFLDVSGLAQGTTYEWKVKAYCSTDGSLSSEWTSLSQFTTLTCDPPIALFTSDITSTSAKLEWVPVPNVAGYVIKGRKQGFPLIEVQIPGAATSEFLVTGLDPSSTYEWQIRTYCVAAIGLQSANSPMDVFTTLAGSPKAVEGGNVFQPWTDAKELNLDFNVYPNPNEGQFNVELTNFSDSQGATMEVYDILGKLVFQKEIVREIELVSLDMSSIEKGTYLIRVTGSTNQTTKRVIIQ